MANITVRNIPDEIFENIKRLSTLERRSLNSEIVVLLEKGTHAEIENMQISRKRISRSLQVHLWRSLSTRWDDIRSTTEIKDDIYRSRTPGREVEL
jgi:plasmid stability protein